MKPAPCRCPLRPFPHRRDERCESLADEQREATREIQAQQSSELAAERRAVIREYRL